MTPHNVPAKLEHFIGGAHTPSADGTTFEVADPVMGVLGASGMATCQHLDARQQLRERIGLG